MILCFLVYVGPCPDCCYTLKQTCQCAKSVQERPCTNLDWKCEQVRLHLIYLPYKLSKNYN